MYNKIVNKTIKILFTCILCICLFIISVFAIPPAYADHLNDYDFSDQPIVVSNNPSVDGISYTFSWANGSATYKYSAVTDNTYSFIAPYSNNLMTIYCVNEIQTTFLVQQSSLLTRDINIYDNTSNLYYGACPNTNDTISAAIPKYSTLAEALAAVRDYIDNPPEPEPSLYEGISIPPGYMARIVVRNGSSFNMTTKLNFRIPNSSGTAAFTQKYKFDDNSNPENVIDTNAITINWSAYGDKDIFGQTNIGTYSLSSTVGSYIWIINPSYSNNYYNGAGSIISTPSLNNKITLSNIVDIDNIRIFAMSAEFGSSMGNYGNITNSVDENDEYTANTSSDGSIYWTNSNGDIIDPPDYGKTQVENSPLNIVQQLENLLSELIGRIERLLVAPVDYINQLIASANQFFLWLRGLWSWLPAPVIESITAVLIVMCTVGALKLLWR